MKESVPPMRVGESFELEEIATEYVVYRASLLSVYDGPRGDQNRISFYIAV